MQIESVALNKIIPYIRNPRKNENAIEKVASSIHEFGFRQPIVVDSKNVIIAGHTRFEAAKRLGMDVVPIHVADGLTEQQAKAYRIADNRVGQEVEWDFDLLKLELEELDNPELTGFEEFEISDFLREINFDAGSEDDQGRLDQLEPKLVNCPHCGKEFDLRE
jgi:ParB-like chromosome segregation protein Spo0J